MRKTVHQIEQEQAASNLARERAEQDHRPDTTALAPDEVGQTIELPEYQIARLEEEKRQLSEALRVPSSHTAGPEALDGLTQRGGPGDGIATGRPTVRITLTKPEPVVPEQGQTVSDAETAQQAAQAELEAATAKLAESEKAVTGARSRAAAIALSASRSGAHGALSPLVDKVRKHRVSLLAIFNEYDGTLKVYAQSCASGDLQERTVLQAVYSTADPCRQRLARAFKACEDALRGADKILTGKASVDAWNVSASVQALETALTHDAGTIRNEAAALVARYSSIRGAKTPGRVLGDPGGRHGVDTGNWHA